MPIGIEDSQGDGTRPNTKRSLLFRRSYGRSHMSLTEIRRTMPSERVHPIWDGKVSFQIIRL